MLITIPAVLNANEVAEARYALDAASWVDGKVTAGNGNGKLAAARGPCSLQCKLGEMVLAALARSPLFMSAALLFQRNRRCLIDTLEAVILRTRVDTAIGALVSTGTSHRYFGDVFLQSLISMTAATFSSRRHLWNTPP